MIVHVFQGVSFKVEDFSIGYAFCYSWWRYRFKWRSPLPWPFVFPKLKKEYFPENQGIGDFRKEKDR